MYLKKVETTSRKTESKGSSEPNAISHGDVGSSNAWLLMVWIMIKDHFPRVDKLNKLINRQNEESIRAIAM